MRESVRRCRRETILRHRARGPNGVMVVSLSLSYVGPPGGGGSDGGLFRFGTVFAFYAHFDPQISSQQGGETSRKPKRNEHSLRDSAARVARISTIKMR